MGRPHTEETKKKISQSAKARNRGKTEQHLRKKITDGFEKGSGRKTTMVQNQAGTTLSYLAEESERQSARSDSMIELDNKDRSRRRRKRDYGLSTQKSVSSDN